MAWPDEIDTSEDYLVWTNTVTVNYLSKTAEAVPPTGPQVSHVLWTAIRKDRLRADSLLAKFDRTFRFAKVPLNGIIPKNDDVIVDNNGVRWIVGMVEIVSFGNEFRCHTTKGKIQNTPVVS